MFTILFLQVFSKVIFLSNTMLNNQRKMPKMGLVSHAQPQKKKSKAWIKTYLAILSKSVLAIHTFEWKCRIRARSLEVNS